MKRVAVLRGGPSDEYDVSMQTGVGVLHALDNLQYPRKDIVVTKKGEWLENGIVRSPHTALGAVDVVFLALHGAYGEDGQVQRIIERTGVPFTGSRSLPSAIAFNKHLTKQTLRAHGISMPRHRQITREHLMHTDRLLDEIFADLGKEVFVKPVASGSSIGVHFVNDRELLEVTIQQLLTLYDQVLVEERIHGREATVGVLGNFRDQDLYVLPVAEIVPPASDDFFNYENKYNGSTEEIVPGRFSYGQKEKLAALALRAHEAVGCRHFSRSDFMVTDDDIFFLEINTLPGLTAESVFPKAAEAVGLSYTDLIKHLVDTAGIRN